MIDAYFDLDLDLDAWRDRVLSRILRSVVVVAGIATAGGIALSLQHGMYGVAVFDAVAWLAMVGVWRGAFAYRARAFAIVAIVFLVGVVILGLVGPVGVGHLWLIGAPLTAALLSGRTAFFLWLTGAELALFAFALASRTLNPWPQAPVDGVWWILVMSSVASIALLVGLPMLELLRGLDETLAVRARARDLAQERERKEAALRAQFELLFAESPAALLLVDPSGAVVRHNVLAQQLFDIGTGEVGAGEPAHLAALLGAQAQDAARRMQEAPALADVPAFDETLDGTSLSGRRVVAATRIRRIQIGDVTHTLVGAVDIGERVAAQQALQDALSEKVTLLQEVHHRVKNNLQIVSSLLGLQADAVGSPEARKVLLDSTYRIRTMALIHQQLYDGEHFTRIDFDGYARVLLGELCAALDPNARVTLEFERVELMLANALPCGLILNELVSNTLKHGRSEDGVCRIHVLVGPHEAGFVLEVRDQGAGLPAPWREMTRQSLGGNIIAALVRQLRATLHVDAGPEGGARFRLVVPMEPDGVSRSTQST
jgi:two-component sensor histidine kinase/PAS domain-containing protein